MIRAAIPGGIGMAARIIFFIAIIISLCIATPVFAEFRYSYALYSSIPFVIFSAFLSNNIREEKV